MAADQLSKVFSALADPTRRAILERLATYLIELQALRDSRKGSPMNSTTLTPLSDTQFVVERRFDAPLQLVWDAHTKPEHLLKWLTGPHDMKLTAATLDLRAGGTYEWEYTGPDGSKQPLNGEFLEVEAPHRIVQKDNWGPDLPAPNVEFAFSEDDGQTLLKITFTVANKELRDHVTSDSGLEQGYGASFDNLDAVLPTLA